MNKEIKYVPSEIEAAYTKIVELISTHNESVGSLKTNPVEAGYLRDSTGKEVHELYYELQNTYNSVIKMNTSMLTLFEKTKEFLDKTYKDVTGADLAAAASMKEDL